MDNFADIFKTYQKMGETKDETGKASPRREIFSFLLYSASGMADLKATLSRWTDPNSAGKKRANLAGDGFAVK